MLVYCFHRTCFLFLLDLLKLKLLQLRPLRVNIIRFGTSLYNSFLYHFNFSSDDSECPNNGFLRGANGSFTSPGFPLPYPDSVTCTWIIEVPENYHVELRFDTFRLETCVISSLCTCDHVQVRDGQTASSPELKELCGDQTPSPLRSTGRYLWVEFKSDSRTVGNGFRAFFKAVRKYAKKKSLVLINTFKILCIFPYKITSSKLLSLGDNI